MFDGIVREFVKWTEPVRARGFVLATYDGCPCHFVYRALQHAADNKAVILCFPAHISHIAQPLDHSSCFGGLKRKLRRDIRSYLRAGYSLKVDHIAQLYTQARENTLTPKAIAAAFRETGLFPVDRSKLMSHGHLAPSMLSATSDQQELTLQSFPTLPPTD